MFYWPPTAVCLSARPSIQLSLCEHIPCPYLIEKAGTSVCQTKCSSYKLLHCLALCTGYLFVVHLHCLLCAFAAASGNLILFKLMMRLIIGLVLGF